MINCTRLLCAKPGFYDEIRYVKGKPADTNRPIVVWNTTRSCNLRCVHCYIDAQAKKDKDELSTEQARAMIDDLAAFGAPVLLFSSGVRAGLRFAINKHNFQDISGIFDLIEKEGIHRACFYHLVYAGRGREIVKDDL